jgi:pyruvate ferredoxin oxidoreductase alpha subunit
VEVYKDASVQTFVGQYQPQWPLLDLGQPKTYGPLDFYDYYYEHKRQQIEAMAHAPRVIREIAGEFNHAFDRSYGLFEPYRLADAEVAIVVANSTAGTAKAVVDGMRSQGERVGLLKPRVFRPFPGQEIAEALSHLKAVAVMDRSVSFGSTDNAGPLFLELVAALALHGRQASGSPGLPLLRNYVYGLGGRDTGPREIESVYDDLLRAGRTGEVERPVTFLGVRD